MSEILENHKDIIAKTPSEQIKRIDGLMENIRTHINKLDPILHENKANLLLAVRLVESFRILEWIKICLICGSYHSAYRELRYLIEGFIQAYYIDTNIKSANLKVKFEAFKIFDQDTEFFFIGERLINKCNGMPCQTKLRSLFKELSDYIHPTYKQSLDFMEKASEKKPWDRMKKNIFDINLLLDCISKCEDIIECFLRINKHFELEYLIVGKKIKKNE